LFYINTLVFLCILIILVIMNHNGALEIKLFKQFLTRNPKVVGSNPTAGTLRKKMVEKKLKSAFR
jgi:hypothetical protein